MRTDPLIPRPLGWHPSLAAVVTLASLDASSGCTRAAVRADAEASKPLTG